MILLISEKRHILMKNYKDNDKVTSSKRKHLQTERNLNNLLKRVSQISMKRYIFF